MLTQLKTSSLDKRATLKEIEDQLFFFFQNLRLEKDLQAEVDEYCIQVQGNENAEYLTFKLEMPKKLKNFNQNLALFLAMMPQYLSGTEFKHIDEENELVNSPKAQLHAIVAFQKEKFVTFVDVEGNWVLFKDEEITKLNFYENVIEAMLVHSLFPTLLIYKVGPCLLQKRNTAVSQMLDEYLEMVEEKKFNKDMVFPHKVRHLSIISTYFILWFNSPPNIF